MRTVVTIQVFILVFISTFYQEVSGQSFYPPYGGAPIVYDNSDDGDIGLLLTVLLLATRNRNNNCNCCNYSNCGSSTKAIPVPYPIPFPTNNPIINNKSQPPYCYRSCCNNDDDDNDDDDNNNDVKVKNESKNSNSLIDV